MSLSGLEISATGIATYSGQIAVISNNVANIDTNAFKRSEPRFQDLLYDQVQVAGANANGSSTGVGIEYGRGVGLATVPTIFQQGPLEPGINLDVAIDGPGFFRVRDSEGNIFYTRLGAFQPKGVGGVGPLNIQLSNRTLVLDPSVILPGNNAETTIDNFGVVRQGSFTAQINLTQVQNPDGLEQVGDLLFRATPASGATITTTPGQPGFGSLVENRLEGSNVDFSNELINLLQASQNFNLNSKAFIVSNEEIRQVIALVQQV
jgi:flagellar basal-body rod protein FlgG